MSAFKQSVFTFSISLSLSFKLYVCAGRLNWWTSTGRLPSLEPLATSGDGNCLLHAASLYMWGFHDHFLILRTALHRVLTTALEKEGIKRRWKYQTQLRNDEAGGLTFSEEEWEFEWEEILRIATNKPRQLRTTDSLRRYSSLRVSYESLEEVHIFALAHTLRRPIIIISDRTVKDHQGQDLAPIYFGGIYLPLELNPNSCCKSPVVLAFDSSHFSALVAKQDSKSGDKKQLMKGRGKPARVADLKEPVIPLVTPDGALLPVQFIYDPEKRSGFRKWAKMQYEPNEFAEDISSLLEAYLNIRWIQLKVSTATSVPDRNSSTSTFPITVPKVRFPAANVGQELQPQYQKELLEKYLEHIKARYAEEKEKKAKWQAETEQEEKRRQQNKTVPCEGEGCDMFGRPATNNLCSVCYQKLMQEETIESSIPHKESSAPRGIEASSSLEGKGYDIEEEEDIANMHRRLVASTPSPPPPPYFERDRSCSPDSAPYHRSNSGMSPIHHVAQNSPAYNPPAYNPPAYNPPIYNPEVVDRVRRSPVHSSSSQPAGFEASPRRGIREGTVRSPAHISPSHIPPSHSDSRSNASTVKQPMIPPKMTRLSPSHKSAEGGWVSSTPSGQSSSSVPTSPSRGPVTTSSPQKEQPAVVRKNKQPPLPVPAKKLSPPPEQDYHISQLKAKRTSPSPEKENPPPIPFKNRRLSPSPDRDSSTLAANEMRATTPPSPERKELPSLAPKSTKTTSSSERREAPFAPKGKKFSSPPAENETSKSSPSKSANSVGSQSGDTKKWVYNPILSKITPSSGSGYTRDKIQPLHLEPTSQRSGPGHFSNSPGRSKCKTPKCDFFGNPITGGYCSSCTKKIPEDSMPNTLV